MPSRRVVIGLVALVAVGIGVSLLPARSATTQPGTFPDDWHFGQPQQRAQQNALVGQPMPKLDLADWIGQPLTEADLKGKIVIVDFWATWCGPCLAAVPHNNEIYAKYKDKGVELIGVCTSSHGQEKMAAIAKQHNMAYPVARDPQLTSQKAWAVMWYPTYAVVDRKGTLRALGLKPNAVDKVVDALLEEQPATQPAIR